MLKGIPNPTDMAVINNYLYIGEYPFIIIDISDPANPIEIHSIKDNQPVYDMVIEGNYAYTARGYFDIAVFDISNPIKPVKVDYFQPNGYGFYTLTVNKNFIYANGSHFNKGLLTLRHLETTNTYLPVVVK